MFSVRIVTTSHYQAKPIPGLDTTHSEFRNNAAIKRVPVLRIFGSTPAGQKTCMHVHGVFPYLYVPYDGTQPLDRYLRQFAASLDKALNVANRSTNSTIQHVYKITLVSGIPMYGYHLKEEHFLKIYLINPNNIRRAADLLLGGAVMNRPFQPHESHIPYPLQLFIDYNLYGMNLVNVAALKFRKRGKDGKNAPQGSRSDTDNLHKDETTLDRSLLSVTSSSPASSPLALIWNAENIPSEMWLPESVERQSTCELEVDVVAADITNRQDLANNRGANPGLAALWEDERQRRRDMGESSQLGPDSSQERVGVVPSDSETELLKRFLDIVQQQQEFRSSQSVESTSHPPSQSASQLESHISREDSVADSQSTVIVEDSEDSEGGATEADVLPIISMDSIEKVVARSQSFCLGSSQKATPDSQDRSIADILAFLLEEAGPTPSQLSSLEERDSILNHSIVLDENEEKEEEEETLIMSQVEVKDNEMDEAEQAPGFGFDVGKLDETWDPGDDADIVMNTDDDDDDDDSDEVDLLPQFDGASDKVPGSDNKPIQSQIPDSLTQGVGPSQGPEGTSSQQASDPTTSAWRGGTTGRSVASDGPWQQQQQHGWPQQQQGISDTGPWHGHHSTAWPQQQYQQPWPQMSSSPGFPSQQPAFHTSPTMSPSHNPFSSPTHQQIYKTPSPSSSSSHQPFQYSPYQSPTQAQPYQQPYRSPSSAPIQSPSSTHAFHSPHSFSSSLSQSYHSPTSSQPYSPLGATAVGQLYQLPGSDMPYMSPTSDQPYQSPSVSQPYQSPGYQPSISGHIYSSPYQAPQSSPQQSLQAPFQTPSQSGTHYPSWSPQGYPTYYQGHTGSQGSFSQSSSGKCPGGPSQLPHCDTFYQPGPAVPSDQGGQTQDLQQQQLQNPALQQQLSQTGATLPSSQLRHKTSQEPISDKPQPRQKRAYRKRKDSKVDIFKPPKSISQSPLSTVSTNPFDFCHQPTASVLSDSFNTESFSFDVDFLHSDSQNISGGSNCVENNIQSAGTSCLHPGSVTKISTLEFKPNTQALSFAATSFGAESSRNLARSPLCRRDDGMSGVGSMKSEMSSSTPMIQQLLMEEPVRMNISKEDRDAFTLKKPAANPTIQKPKRKYTRREGSTGRKPGRPRSTSLTSHVLPASGCYGYSQPAISPPVVGQQRRLSAPFSCDSRLQTPVQQNSSWQQQQNVPQTSMWHQHHQQHPQMQWGMNMWPGYGSPGDCNNSRESGSPGLISGRFLHRSFSADTVQASTYGQNSQPDDLQSFFENQTHQQSISSDIDQESIAKEAVNDKSSLSSLLQLVSDVGSDEIAWEGEQTSVTTSLFPHSNESERPKSSLNLNLNQGSPLVKDFVTLEATCGQVCERESSVMAGFTSSEESDHMDLDLSGDRKSKSMSRSLSLGNSGLRKQGGLKSLSLAQSHSIDLGSVSDPVDLGCVSDPVDFGCVSDHIELGCMSDPIDVGCMSGPTEPDPTYTYTFHVPTPVFKKLKFFMSEESRKCDVPVVRIHPMDARRYSLLKIGREIVKVVKLSEADLTGHGVSQPPQVHFVSVDGSSNRVNLDIPVVSVDRRSGDSGSEENSLSRFDTDFPPNKVAPPSSFHASQVSAAMTMPRTASTNTRSSPIVSDRPRQHSSQQHSTNYNESFGLGLHQGTFGLQRMGPDFVTYSGHHQQVPQSHTSTQFSRQLSEESSGIAYQQFNEKSSSFYTHPAHTPTHPCDSYYRNQPSGYAGNSYYQQQYYQHNSQQQSHDFQQQQPQAAYSGSNREPKNGLRSPGQHGPASRIDSGNTQGDSGDENEDNAEHEGEDDDSTTDSYPVNTRANAARRESHAEHMPNTTVAQDCDAHTNTPISVLDNRSSTRPIASTGNSINLGEDTKHKDGLNHFHKKPDTKDKIKKLSLRKSGGVYHFYSPNDENNSNLAQNDVVNHENLADKDVLSRKVLENSTDSVPGFPNKLNSSVTRCKKERKKSKRNVKSLCLTIPGQHSVQSFQDSYGDAEKESVTSSGEESEGTDNDDDDSRSRPGRRTISVGKSKKGLKTKENVNKQKPSVNGDYYIVAGTLKRHGAMLVKMNKLKVKPTEKMEAETCKKLTEKDVIRSTTLLTCPQIIETCTESLGIPNSTINSTETRTNVTEVSQSHSKTSHNLVSNLSASSNQIFCRPSRGRSARFGKFRSAHVPEKKHKESFSETSTLASFIKHATFLENPVNGVGDKILHITEDRFFLRFQEKFTKHSVRKQVGIEDAAENQKVTFFSGVRRSSFHDFQQRFLANIRKMRSNTYSSSSDDEEDILDKIVLMQKFVVPQAFSVHKPRNSSTSYETRKWSCGNRPQELAGGKDGITFCTKEAGKNKSQNKSRNSKQIELFLQQDIDFTTTKSSCQQSENSKTSPSESVLQENVNRDHKLPNSQMLNKRHLHDNLSEAMSQTFSKRDENYQKCHGISENRTSESRRDAEDQEDYLERQMAFFEDISSDSDSSNTIILDTFIGGDTTSQANPPISGISSPPTLSISTSDELRSSANKISESTPSKTTSKKIGYTNMGEDPTEVGNCEIFTSNEKILEPEEHSNVLDSVTTKYDGTLSELTQLSHATSQSDFSGKVTNLPPSSPNNNFSHASEFPKKELAAETEKTLLKFEEKKIDICFESDEATIELDIISGTANSPSNKEGFDQVHSPKEGEPATGKMHDESAMEKQCDKTVDSDHDMDTSISTDILHRPKRHGKGMKKSKRDKGSRLVNRRQLLDDGNSSSNDEMSILSESFAPSKVLRQRKQTFYTFYDMLDSTEEDSSESSDEEFSARGSHRKGSKQNRKQKASGLKDKHLKKLQQNSMDKSSKSGQKSRLSRGKKKKPLAGDKLLNSLSLLHMATLANLSETQPDSLDNHIESDIAAQSESERSWQYSFRAGSDHSSTFTPSLEHMAFISPQNSDGVEISPPVACSPTDKIKLKQSRGAHREEDITASRRLLNSPRPFSLKPGCNGASNLGSKPLPFSRLVTSTSSSPVPSNFAFNHILDLPQQQESTIPIDDPSTSGTLHLLETRRAQVNCASFSMRDILRLTTTDDSMDSDSKDSAAIVKPPEPKRAQVKSTALSMSDILKLTTTDKTAEARSSPTSYSVLSLLSNSEPSTNTTQKLVKVAESEVQPPSSQQFLKTLAAFQDLTQKTDSSETFSQKIDSSQGPMQKTDVHPTSAQKTDALQASAQINDVSQAPAEKTHASLTDFSQALSQKTDSSETFSQTTIASQALPQKTNAPPSIPQKTDSSQAMPQKTDFCHDLPQKTDKSDGLPQKTDKSDDLPQKMDALLAMPQTTESCCDLQERKADTPHDLPQKLGPSSVLPQQKTDICHDQQQKADINQKADTPLDPTQKTDKSDDQSQKTDAIQAMALTTESCHEHQQKTYQSDHLSQKTGIKQKIDTFHDQLQEQGPSNDLPQQKTDICHKLLEQITDSTDISSPKPVKTNEQPSTDQSLYPSTKTSLSSQKISETMQSQLPDLGCHFMERPSAEETNNENFETQQDNITDLPKQKTSCHLSDDKDTAKASLKDTDVVKLSSQENGIMNSSELMLSDSTEINSIGGKDLALLVTKDLEKTENATGMDNEKPSESKVLMDSRYKSNKESGKVAHSLLSASEHFSSSFGVSATVAEMRSLRTVVPMRDESAHHGMINSPLNLSHLEGSLIDQDQQMETSEVQKPAYEQSNRITETQESTKAGDSSLGCARNFSRSKQSICQVSSSKSHPLTSVLEVPRISVTCGEADSVSERFGNEQCESASRSSEGGGELANRLNVKGSETDLKPLNPLQIPPYPYLSHCLGLQPGQVLHPSLYYPFCWQWAVHTPSSDSLLSPLNLCTIQRSPNNSYSPITPTSPISPSYLVPAQDTTSPSMSPPRKKKPLWYPWLTIDHARNKPSTETSPATWKTENPEASKFLEKCSNKYSESDLAKKSSTSEKVSSIRSQDTGKTSSEKEKVFHSKIIDLLSGPPIMANSSSSRINSVRTSSSCQTVSQFLGLVIDTAYEHGRNEAIASPSDKMTDAGTKPLSLKSAITKADGKLSFLSPKSTTNEVNKKNIHLSPNSVINLPDRKRNSSFKNHEFSSDNRNQESASHILTHSQIQHLLVTSAHDKNQNLTKVAKLRKMDSPPVRNASEHQQPRGNRGIDKEKSDAPAKSGNYLCTNRKDLTDRLITKLIKGDSHELYHPKPSETAGSQKQPGHCDQPSSGISQKNTKLEKQQLSNSEGNKESGKEDGDAGKGHRDDNNQHKKAKDILSNESGTEVTLRPLRLPPSRSLVEENLITLGLNSVQPLVAFCSNPQDLPDRPVEHGGRVLRVESRRLCELPSFASSQHVIGIRNWRNQSLSSTNLLSSQGQGRPLWERLEQDPQLKCLLSGDRPMVASPVHVPPSRSAVSKWLKDRMTVLKGDKTQCANSEIDNTASDSKTDEKQQNYDNQTPNTESKQCDILKEKKKDKTINDSISEQDLSYTFISEGNSSVQTATNLDMSLLLDTTSIHPAAPAKTSLFPILTSPHAKSHDQESHQLSSPSLAAKNERKRKLRYSNEDSGDEMKDNLSLDFNTRDKNLQKSKEKSLKSKIPSKLTDSSVTSSIAARSTPLQQPFRGRQQLQATLTDSLIEEQETLNSPEWSHDTPRSSQVTEDVAQVSLLKHVSTNTENMLKKSILTSQTQRQASIPGLNDVSQIEGPTPKNAFGFKVAQTHVQDSKALHKYQYVTVLSMELHIRTRGNLRPDPEFDSIQAVFYSIFDDIPPERGKQTITGVIISDFSSWSEVAERSRRNDRSPDSTDPATSAQCSAGPSCPPSQSQSLTTDHKPSLGSDMSISLPGQSTCPDQQKTQPSLPPSCTAHHTSSSSSSDGTTASSPSQSTPPAGQKKIQPPLPESSIPASDKGESKERIPVSSVRTLLEKCGVDDLKVTYVKDEMDLLETFSQLVIQCDPDILVGFEIQMLSWGYILQRAAHLNMSLCSRIARVQDAKDDNRFSAEKDEWGADHMSEIHVAGRIVLNLWRILRHEVTLNVYSFENVVYHVLHRRVPTYSFRVLTKWYNHDTHLHRWRVIEYYLLRVQGQLEVIDQLDLIGKTSEFARVFGIEFYDVLARGSQIRVESMMLRLAKPMNFVPVSPSVAQRVRQKTAECIALNLEPESKYYTSPVAVLDFQSLYPSIMIAYNYCFSTCLGRLSSLQNAHEGPFEFGCTSLNVTASTLQKIRDDATISPNGIAFIKSSVRRGVLPIMVEEILNTRLMVKKSMKQYKDDKILSRMLDARQLGLKLIANVTYGYTGASFSGRMPCIEVGDSIVRKARECLERAIALVEGTPKWRAHVVYGDTDSMFIHFPGRSKDEAFVLGQEIADAVTAMFPSPIKLRFEKVYLPCVLQTKKRYVGFMYETAEQKEPVYDAKGIETVRRDACSAVAKILERSIKILFSTHDLSRVKSYVMQQMTKLLEGKVSIIDLIFAKEFRGMMGYKPGACVPALEIARKRVKADRRSEPRVGERVPYVIVHGSPGMPLIQLVREPSDLVADSSLRLNSSYYITKQILPPLNRIFSLIGISVFRWYQEMPKVVRIGPMVGAAPAARQGTISQFFATSNCPICDAQTKQPICLRCGRDPQLVVLALTTMIRNYEKTSSRLAKVCDTCQGTRDMEQSCVSTDCPIMFRRVVAKQDLVRADNLQEVLGKYLQF